MSLQERYQTADASLTIKVVPVHVQSGCMCSMTGLRVSGRFRCPKTPRQVQGYLCIIKHGKFQTAERQLLLHSWAAHKGKGGRILKDGTAARAKGCVVGLGEVL